MSYITDYKININPYDKPRVALLKERLESITGYGFEVKGKSVIVSDFTWYEDSKVLVQISSEDEFRDVLITAHCTCREDMARWEIHAKNGKGYRQDAIVTMPEFDESKLSDDEGDW